MKRRCGEISHRCFTYAVFIPQNPSGSTVPTLPIVLTFTRLSHVSHYGVTFDSSRKSDSSVTLSRPLNGGMRGGCPKKGGEVHQLVTRDEVLPNDRFPLSENDA